MRNKEIAAASVYARSMYGDARLVSAFVCGCAFEMGREAARKRRRLVGDGWITINGTHVETKGGRLMGPVGRKIESVKSVQAAGSVEADRGTGEAANHVSQQAQTTAQVGVREALGDESYRAVQKVLEGTAPGIKSVWGALESRLKVVETNLSAFDSAYTDLDGCIHFNAEKVASGDYLNEPYATLFHEGAHAIDRMCAPPGKGHFSAVYNNGELARTAVREVRWWQDRYETHVGKALTAGNEALRKGATTWEAAEKTERVLMKIPGAGDYLAEKAVVIRNTIDEIKSAANGDPKRFSRIWRERKGSIARELLARHLNGLGALRIASVSDIFDGASQGQIHGRVKHGASYWTENGDGTMLGKEEMRERLGSEVFANLFSAHALNGQDLLGLKKYLPKTCAVFDKMMFDVLLASRRLSNKK